MSTITITSQPRRGRKGVVLDPLLAAKAVIVQHNRGSHFEGARLFEGDYSAMASLTDLDGNHVSGSILGDYNVSGVVNRHGTEITFKWNDLAIAKRGRYRFVIRFIEFDPRTNETYSFGTATTDPIEIR